VARGEEAPPPPLRVREERIKMFEIRMLFKLMACPMPIET